MGGSKKPGSAMNPVFESSSEQVGLQALAQRDRHVRLYTFELATLGVQAELYDIPHPGAIVTLRVSLMVVGHQWSATGKLQIRPVNQLLQMLAESLRVLHRLALKLFDLLTDVLL